MAVSIRAHSSSGCDWCCNCKLGFDRRCVHFRCDVASFCGGYGNGILSPIMAILGGTNFDGGNGEPGGAGVAGDVAAIGDAGGVVDGSGSGTSSLGK